MGDSADIEQLRAEARHHRQRLELYEARSYGPRPTSVVRLREYADRTFGAWDLHAAYGDQHHDGPMLALAANPVAVSPTRELARLATAEGWAVRNW